MEDLFPDGARLVPDSITEAMDSDEKTRARTPSKDKVTGQRVWQCRVMDMDAALAGRSREVAVKILADVRPVPPTGVPFEPVEFDGLQVTPVRGADRAAGVLDPGDRVRRSGRHEVVGPGGLT